MGWPEVMNHSSSTGWIWRLWASSGFWTGRGSSRLPQQETAASPVAVMRSPHWGQQGEVRGPQSALPLGDGPVADSQQLGQPLLGQPFFQPQDPDQRTGLFLIHRAPSF